MRFMLMFIVMMTLPVMAWAKPDVTISVVAKQQIVVEENGQKVTKLVEANDVVPSDVLIYQLNYQNVGDEPAVGATLVNPVPDNTMYVDGSAFGPGSDIDFSIDGGKHYKRASLLTYEVKLVDGTVEKRTASPEQYTHIRWTVSQIPAGKSGTASFQVRVQ